MAYLFFEIWGWLMIVAGVGVAAGWLLSWRELQRVRMRYRAKLHRVTQNWEFVESRLTVALEELHVVRAELNERTKERDALAARVGSSAPPAGRSRNDDELEYVEEASRDGSSHVHP